MTRLARVVRRVADLGRDRVVVELVPGGSDNEPLLAFRDFRAKHGRVEIPLAAVRTIAYAKAAGAIEHGRRRRAS